MTSDAGKLRRRGPRHESRRVPPDSSGRVIIEAVQPQVDGGETPIKRVIGDRIEISADIFTDGHESIAAELLYRVVGDADWLRAPMRLIENDSWRGAFIVDRLETYEYTIEAWRDPFASWRADTLKKIAGGADVSLEPLEGAEIIRRAEPKSRLRAISRRLASVGRDPKRLLDELLSDETARAMADAGPKEEVCRRTPALIVCVDRERARFSAWYELFPRSASRLAGRHGAFDDVLALLPYVRDLGFDVLYFPPIHPIGATNRKGRNNSLTADKSDPGSVYAIGSAAGGHDAIHPELGDLDDFRRLVAAADAQGLEIALDFAIQCSPDHPWIKQHPEWFDWRPDGTIKYAENPPKKYEDIVNIRFDGAAFPAVWEALRDIVRFWIKQGVRIFRVDNPHTKPVPFWKWLIQEISSEHPEVIFLAEAFTRPKMMKKLAKIGFHQSYTYFTWRNSKAELTTYLSELAGEMGEYYRPNFFVNTPDINPYFLQNRGAPAFMIRATFAAMLSSNWGMYSGFEFCESAPLPGREEYLNSEKYELKHRNFDVQGPVAAYIRRLNDIRRGNPALQDFRNIEFLNAWNDQIVACLRMTANHENCIFMMVNLDPDRPQETRYELPLWKFGLPDYASIEVEDLLLGIRFTMYGKTHTIRLDPSDRVSVIWRLVAPAESRSVA